MTDKIQNLDTRLSAYLDGELNETDCEAVEALIASDPQTAARLEALATARADFETASHDIYEIPMSASLTDMLERLKAGRNDKTDDTIVAFPVWQRAAGFVRQHRAIAASVAVATGAMTLQTALPAQMASVEGLPVNSTLQADRGVGRVFEAGTSGESIDVAGGMTVTPRFTFASGNSFCRVADTASNETTARLVACREETGWHVAIASFSAPASGAEDAPYRTASQAGAESVEAFLDSAMTNPPIGANEEAALIENGWPSPSSEQGE